MNSFVCIFMNSLCDLCRTRKRHQKAICFDSKHTKHTDERYQSDTPKDRVWSRQALGQCWGFRAYMKSMPGKPTSGAIPHK